MNQRNRGPGPIPNRWLYCPRKSETLIAGRFIAFKTPLSKDFNDQMPIECLFQPEMIFGWCKTIKIKLGLWIDLTNTKRFYDRSVVEKHDAQYIKLQCRGHGETPSKEQTASFIEFVDNFLKERPAEMIGVHCTHGFNRTGFLIVSYLVESLDWSVEAALACFAQARPPGIYKQDYINELYNRYENGEQPPEAPELPSWCFDCDESAENTMTRELKRSYNEAHCSSQTSQQSQFNGENLNELEDDEIDGDDNDNTNRNETESNASSATKSPKKKRRREFVVKNATFMKGVEGVELVTDQPRLKTLQQKVQDMCGWEKGGFPGSQPVSMDIKNITYLHERPYRVSWKADGTRYMMLINKKDEVYFFDRNNSCFQVNKITFLKAGNLNQNLENTLVDGEMVIDQYNGISTPRYLIYDIVMINNMNIGKEFFPNRLNCIKKELIEPRHQAMMKGLINRAEETFSVRLKDFWDINYTVSLLGEKFTKALLHEPDGLIYQPAKEPYTAGVCPLVLKWKPSELNSVDFRLKIGVESGQGVVTKPIGYLYVQGLDRPFDKINITRQIKKLDNKIIECTVDDKLHWQFLRERTDKPNPNTYTTATAVIESIRHPVTKEILLNYIGIHGFREDHDRMPPPSSHHVHRTSHPHPQQHKQQQQQQQLQQQKHNNHGHEQHQY